MYTDFALFTLPIRGPKISDEFLTKLAIDPKDRMDCDEDEEDRDYLVSLAIFIFRWIDPFLLDILNFYTI
jgi:hypothetical protein